MVAAYRRRDSAYEGIFLVAVRTTGIFCRPTCAVRSPLPKNVEFFATPGDAILAGYRPCKRCQPTASEDHPGWAVELLATIDRDPSKRIRERELRSLGLDPATVRRHFQRRFGMTFQAFLRARRLSGAMSEIRGGESIDRSALRSGYRSHSGFREAFTRMFGAPPGQARSTEDDPVRLAWIETPLGPMLAGANDRGLSFLEFVDRRLIEAQARTLQRHMGVCVPGGHVNIDRVRDELADYFAGKRTAFGVPLCHCGTPFQERVWKALLRIPFATTRSYAQVAAEVGSAQAVRAVGRANGMNRIAILVPCHRVVQANGSLGGYGGGLRRKEFLLRLEHATKMRTGISE
jgi:AraC family transcriptional regulator of adaptative response/methylated-DNA-[protein]-cysteine methyltransferase